jgi:hypothetical protein
MLQAFVFYLAIQGVATEFCCAGQIHRTRDASAVGCHSFARRVEIHRVMIDRRAFWRAAKTEAFALYAIVAGCGRAPKNFPKPAHRPSVRCAARPHQRFYHEASGDKRPRRTLRIDGRGVRYARRPRRTRGGRGVRYARTIINAHHVSYACMQSSCAHHLYAQACSRLTSLFRVANYCRRVDLVCD